MNNYVPYHVHTDLSNGVTNIDSITKFDEYVNYFKELGMKAMAFSEHGSIFEWVKKKVTIEAAGMKYIHAEEFYVTFNEIEKTYDNYHVVLIAKNYEGVRELNTLSSIAFNRQDIHFYHTPRILISELEGISDNIIVTTACLGGPLAKGNPAEQERFLKFLIKHKDNSYLEVQHHNVEMQRQYNMYLANISRKYGIPLIAGTDTHCLNNDHAEGRKILQKSKNIYFGDEDGWDLTAKTYDELIAAFDKQKGLRKEEYLEAIENTNRMADRVEEFDLNYDKKYPKLYPDSMAAYKQKLMEGIKARGIDKYPNYKEYQERIKYETKAIVHNGAIDFMLLEEDYKKEMRKRGVPYGYSRGSVSGSIVAYILRITDVDSIKYNLNFDRFMNVERISLADVDSDWYKEDRWQVRDYLYNKDGLYCSDIITFNTIQLLGAMDDVGRALEMSLDEVASLKDQLEDGAKELPERIIKAYPTFSRYVSLVKGTIVSIGNHPAALIVSPHELNPAIGTFYSKTNENPISQINMKEVDMLNYVKLDVLGLDCVGLIDRTCKAIGIPMLTPDNMDFDDIEVWNDMKDDCTMIFQFESDYAGAYFQSILRDETIEKIKAINPNFRYIDLMSMANGAIRPAGASYREELANGIFRECGHKALNDFFAPTLGYMVYQEQIIGFLHKFCGFTMGEADVVRRHFSKKTGTETDIPIIQDGGYLNEGHYIKGFIKTMRDDYGVEQEEAIQLLEAILQVIKDASDYLFSQNHADPYSFLGFACGWLRYHYPLETITTALNVYKEDVAKTTKIKEFAAKKGIEIKPIEFGKSKSGYFFDKQQNCIYQGIHSIKFCNQQIADELYALGQNKYDSFVELIKDIKEKTSVDARQLKILIILGFFREFGKNKYLLDIMDLYDKFGSRKEIKKDQLEVLGISEYMMKKYSNKETAKKYMELDNIGLLNCMVEQLENKPLSISMQLEAEKEYLDTCITTYPEINSRYYIITDFKTYKDAAKPYVTVRNLNTGEEIKTKVKNRKLFTEQPFGQYSVLDRLIFDEQFKTKCVAGKWVKTDETEQIITGYVVIKR